MKIFNLAFLGLGFFIHSLTQPPNTDIEATFVKDQRTSMNGVHYSYKITNIGETMIEADSYELVLRVNGKKISFDKDTRQLKPGQSIVYKTGKTIYQKKNENLDYVLEIDFQDDNPANNTIQGTTVF